MRTLVLLLLGACAAPMGQAQSVARFAFGAAQDRTSLDGRVVVPVDVRGLADARTVEVRVAYPRDRFLPVGVESSTGSGELRVVAAGEWRPDSLGVYRVVLSHLAPGESTTTLRTRTLFTIYGTRTGAGVLAFQFVPVVPAVVTRTLQVQPAEYGARVETAAEAAPAARGLELTGVHPNPVGAQARIDLHSPRAGVGRLTLHDVLGRTVYAAEVQLGAGATRVLVDTAALASGVYVYRLDLEDARLSGTFLKQP